MICDRLHKIFNGIDRHQFPFNESLIPNNGIYVLFEKGEHAHGGIDRIVRIGTHTGRDNLRQRLSEHFLVENKDRSIFRKNIGRALLNRRKDPFLTQWEIDLTTSAARRKHGGMMDYECLSQIEKEVSAIIRDLFTFCLFQVDDKQYRLDLEERIIATINHCSFCRPSDGWLGNSSPKRQIRESGLWLVQGLKGQAMSYSELKVFEDLFN